MAGWQVRVDITGGADDGVHDETHGGVSGGADDAVNGGADDAVNGGADDGVHIIADILEAAVDAEAASLYLNGGGDDEGGGRWQISLLVAEKPPQGRIHTALDEARRLTGRQAGNPIITPLEDKDWLAENRKSFLPLGIGTFWIYGTHTKTPVPRGKIGLCLDAGQAFGSGRHATTVGCLHMIEAHLPREGNATIADIGCGSGILAMAAAKWNPDAVVIAADNDACAVAVAASNAVRNHLAGAISCGLSEGYSGAVVQEAAPFMMILANILPAPLIAMAGDAGAMLAKDGVLILSGVLEERQDEVCAAHGEAGLECFDKVLISGWVTLAFRHRHR